jgi:recombinational DNA repair protein (RecF pathway)
MIDCNFCHSNTQDNYIYTECAHFVCLPCASLKWDQKYSIKCCNRTTFLEEETCYTLEKINRE